MNEFPLLVYLDEALSRNLNGLIINGFVEKRTSKWIEDRSIGGNVHFANKEHNSDEDRCIKDERDGYKAKNFSNVNIFGDSTENSQHIDGRRIIRREEEIQRTFTLYEIHQQLVTNLTDNNNLKTIQSNWTNENINVGDYIKINGTISADSVNSYIDSYSNLINGLGIQNLDALSNSNLPNTNSSIVNSPNSDIALQSINNIENSNLPNTNTNLAQNNNLMNFSFMNSQLSFLKSMLNNSNTQDVLIKTDSNDIVLTMNNDYISKNYGHIYEKAGCPCNIIGKVVRVCDDDDCIHFLRKSGQPEFFEKMFCHCNKLNSCMESNGICTPKQPPLKVEGKSLHIIPISVCI